MSWRCSACEISQLGSRAGVVGACQQRQQHPRNRTISLHRSELTLRARSGHRRECQQSVVICPLFDMISGMATLYDLSVPTFLQTARAVGGFLDRTTKHCAETGTDLEEVVKARLFPDMAPFHFQIEALTHHAVWGMEAVKTCVFAPPPLVGAMPFADLRAMVGDAITALEAFTRNAVNSWSGRNWTWNS